MFDLFLLQKTAANSILLWFSPGARYALTFKIAILPPLRFWPLPTSPSCHFELHPNWLKLSRACLRWEMSWKENCEIQLLLKMGALPSSAATPPARWKDLCSSASPSLLMMIHSVPGAQFSNFSPQHVLPVPQSLSKVIFNDCLHKS